MLEIGGYRHRALSEDMEIVVRLRRHFGDRFEPAEIAFVPDPICWTEVPSDIRSLQRQRDRWQRGLAETLFSNKAMLFNPKYGAAGLLAFPYFFIIELFGPVVEVFAYLFLLFGFLWGWVIYDFLILFILVDVGFGMLMSLGAVLIEENAYHRYPTLPQFLALSLIALGEHLGYRQMNSFFRVAGLIRHALGDKGWGRLDREGLWVEPEGR